MERLMRAEGILEQKAREKLWEVDWGRFQQHHDLGKTFHGRGEFTNSFREYCRALDVLIDPFLKQRGKEETFQPVWDKAAD
jgi:hypothetical protein